MMKFLDTNAPKLEKKGWDNFLTPCLKKTSLKEVSPS